MRTRIVQDVGDRQVAARHHGRVQPAQNGDFYLLATASSDALETYADTFIENIGGDDDAHDAIFNAELAAEYVAFLKMLAFHSRTFNGAVMERVAEMRETAQRK